MSQARSKFTKTVIGEWIRAPSAPEPQLETAPESPSGDFAASPRRTNGNGSTQSGMVVWSSGAPSMAIVRHPSAQKVFVLDEVTLPPRVDPRLVMLLEPESPRARSFRLLRHRLLGHADPRVIAVTSAEPGEGKTTAAVNLALALADETMARVLLVETNLRRPALGELFGYRPSESFVSRMAESRDATPPYSVAAIMGTRLQVAALPAEVPSDARLDRMLFAVAMQELREVFDYVIIDAAAVLESADADVASTCADGVVVTMRSAKSRRSRVERAVAQLSPARVLGTVLLDG